jgi:hypothetical protein
MRFSDFKSNELELLATALEGKEAPVAEELLTEVKEALVQRKELDELSTGMFDDCAGGACKI